MELWTPQVICNNDHVTNFTAVLSFLAHCFTAHLESHKPHFSSRSIFRSDVQQSESGLDTRVQTDGCVVNLCSSCVSGSLCDSWSGRCYLLSVLDTVLVRSSWRRRGLGFHMLHDFCSWFSTEEFLGVSSPLSPSMVAGPRGPYSAYKEFYGESLLSMCFPFDTNVFFCLLV